MRYKVGSTVPGQVRATARRAGACRAEPGGVGGEVRCDGAVDPEPFPKLTATTGVARIMVWGWLAPLILVTLSGRSRLGK